VGLEGWKIPEVITGRVGVFTDVEPRYRFEEADPDPRIPGPDGPDELDSRDTCRAEYQQPLGLARSIV